MDYEQRKEEYRERIKSLRLIDDVFMSKVFDGNVEGRLCSSGPFSASPTLRSRTSEHRRS